MSYQIPCHQFVYGKLIGIRRTSYELIAHSNGINETETFEIYKEFNGYRPSSVDIETFSTSYAIKLLKNQKQLAFLRMARSAEPELGRNFFLQERYIIANLSDLTQSNLTAWLWLLGIPAKSSTFTDYTNDLPAYLKVNKRELQETIGSAQKKLTDDTKFRNSVLLALHHILDTSPIIFEHKNQLNHFSLWSWVAALGLLLPNKKIITTGFFWGKHLPVNFHTAVNIVNQHITRNKNIISISLEDKLLEQQEYQNIHTSYTNLSARCLGTKDIRLINDLTDIVEKTPFQESPAKPLDVLLWLSTMPEIGLKLARKTSEKKDAFLIDDIQWLWQNAFHKLTSSDIKAFLPLLLEHTINSWESLDFENFKKLLNEKPGLLLELELQENITTTLLEKWNLHTKEFSEIETNHFIPLLTSIGGKKPEKTIQLLVKWIKKSQADDLLDKTLLVIQSINPHPYLEKSFWEIVLSVKAHVTTQHKLSVFISIVEKLAAEPEKNQVLQFLNIISSKSNKYSSEIEESFKEILHSLASSDGKNLLPYLFIFNLYSKNNELTNFAIALQQTETFITIPLTKTEKQKIQDYYNYLIQEKSHEYKVIASFLYIIGRFGMKNITKDKLFCLLKEKTSLYINIIKFMQLPLKTKRELIELDCEKVNTINNQSEKFRLLTTYIQSTDATPYTKTGLETLYDFLLNITSIDIIPFHEQQNLLEIFRKQNHLLICHKVIELQIRSALLEKKIKKSKDKYEELVKCVSLMKTKHKSAIWTGSIIKYFRKLDAKEKQAFLNWLLREPISTSPKITKNIAFIATSSILKNNPEWFTLNPNIRLFLFREAFNFIFKHDI